MAQQNSLTNYAARPHVLVVDDDQRIRELVSRYLTEHEFVVMAAADAAQARQMTDHYAFDALVVDVMMPGESGLEFTQYASKFLRVPVLLLTALGTADDRISGFKSGADDYLPKPFEPRELVLRLQAIIRRTAKKAPESQAFRIGRWVFDPAREELRDGDEILNLTAAEITLVKALALRSGEAISRDELARKCGVDADTRNIDVQVTRLRRKIEQDTKNPRYLQTIRGKGYMLRVDEP